MPIEVRRYREEDFEMIESWCKGHHTPSPLRGMMIEDGTLILLDEGQPMMCITALETQSKEISYLEGFCSKPGIEANTRSAYSDYLATYCFQYLKSRGFSRVICFSPHASLTRRYEELSFRRSMDGLTSLIKEL